MTTHSTLTPQKPAKINVYDNILIHTKKRTFDTNGWHGETERDEKSICGYRYGYL
jgi:hypothetical protein